MKEMDMNGLQFTLGNERYRRMHRPVNMLVCIVAIERKFCGSFEKVPLSTLFKLYYIHD